MVITITFEKLNASGCAATACIASRMLIRKGKSTLSQLIPHESKARLFGPLRSKKLFISLSTILVVLSILFISSNYQKQIAQDLEESEEKTKEEIWKRFHCDIHLDETINVNVTSTLLLNSDFSQTEFDNELIELQKSELILLHQIWRDSCILKTKVKHMKSWVSKEERIRIIFWTDANMEKWVARRFSNTKMYKVWQAFEGSGEEMIKKADIFRVLLIWYYGGIYADLDIRLKRSFREFLKEKSTLMVWEPIGAMEYHTEFREGCDRKTLVLSGFLLSGKRLSNFTGFYINWIIENHLSGRSSFDQHVLDATGPKAEAEAYYYYISRLSKHDSLLQVLTYNQFSLYGEHYTESTWDPKNIKDIRCVDIRSIYSEDVLIMGNPI